MGHIAAILVILATATPPSTSTSDSAATLAAPVDSATSVALETIHATRVAYRAAWAQRQVGDYKDAIDIASDAVRDADALMSSPMSPPLRMELSGMRARLASLMDATVQDRAAADAAAAAGNEADDSVLDAPAIDQIEAQMNPDVQKWIDYYTTSGRATFERWWKRAGRYMDLFQTVLRKEGLPPDLAHLVFVESGFNVNARSRSAAVGPWQFLRSTGRLFGLTVNNWVDERRDPEKSTVAAARYLKHLYTIFGDWPLALASYNAGEGNVLRAIKRQGTTNYWDLRLPRQTEDYVPQFMAVLHIGRNPEKYGFDSIERDPPMAFDEIALQGAVDLGAVAKLAGCGVQEIRELNPGVLRNGASGTNGVTTLRVPPNKGEKITAALEVGEGLPKQKARLTHVVQRGETLSGIGSRYHVSANLLALENGIGKKNLLRIGQELVIPTVLPPPKLADLDDDDPRGSTAYVPERDIRPPAQLNLTNGSEAEGRFTVRVRRGETLSQIADRYGVSVEDIKSWNRLTSSHVRRGTRLKIRTGPAAAMQLATEDSIAIATLRPPGYRKYGSIRTTIRVRSGETLSEIAARHGTSIKALRYANGLHTSRIYAGQRLKIPGSSAAMASAGGDAAGTHTVRRGDTLDAIARRHGTSIRAIQEMNGLHSTTIKIGQVLKVPAS